MKKPLPKVKPNILEAKKPIDILINAGQYQAASSFALNAFSEYRIKVLSWVYRIKAKSLELCELKPEPYIFATPVFDVFNLAQEKLDKYHEQSMTDFQSFCINLFKTNPQQHAKKRNALYRRLENRLNKYQQVVRQAKQIFRYCLSFL